jgi:hypothetical protein
MLAKLRDFLKRFNDYTQTIQSVLFWLHVAFWLAVLVGWNFGFLTVVTSDWLRGHGFIASALASEQHRRPIVGLALPSTVTVILGR